MDPENEGSLLDGITKGILNNEKFIERMNCYET